MFTLYELPHDLSLMEVVAWIVFRDPEVLHLAGPRPSDPCALEAWLKLRDAHSCDGWLDNLPDGAGLSLGGMDLHKLALDATEDSENLIAPSVTACADLQRRLADGRLPSRGLHENSNRREDIPRDEWHGKTIDNPPREYHRLSMVVSFGEEGPRFEGAWREIVVATNVVTSLWPMAGCGAPLMSPAAGSASPTAGAEKRLEAWLVKMMRAAPNAPENKASMRSAAKAAGHVVSDRGWNRVWAKAVHDSDAKAWSLPGRKSQRRIDTPT